MTGRPGLLVSVRSAEEALAVLAGGASVVDVKEPDRGPLGMADPGVWGAVRAAVRGRLPVSVALGELRDWIGREPPAPEAFSGIAFRKLGLAGASSRWADEWADLRARFGDGPPWVAVIYADWREAGAPDPRSIVRAAREAGCPGVLIDTWGKRAPSPVDASWRGLIEEIRSAVGLVALAGGLNPERIARLRPLGPDLFAVRGAACAGGDRRGTVEASRVAELVGRLAVPATEALAP